MSEGTQVVHSTFGTGTVVHVGPYRGTQAAWIDFDRGDRKVLDPEYAAAHTRLRVKGDRTSAPLPHVRCDVCGGRPVVVSIAGANRTQQFCEEHKGAFEPSA